MKLKIASLATALAVLGGGLALAGASDLGHMFSSGTNKGAFVVARAHGNATKPHALFVKVTSKPRLLAAGNYTTDCDKKGTGGTRGDKFRGKTPVVVKLHHRFRNPDRCEVTASAQIAGKGWVKIALYAKRRH
jgi:hypothetical protein